MGVQADNVFSNVGVLIYVFDIESREFDRDLTTFKSIIGALAERSSAALVFCLIHKMDLVQDYARAKLFDERAAFIRSCSGPFEVTCFPTSIWDQSLYKAWASIIWKLIPNLNIIQGHLRNLANSIEAEEIVLFERTTFLVVTHVTSTIGEMNPCKDRFERLSNIIKSFKQTLAKHTGLPRASAQFLEMTICTVKFGLFVAKFTPNTYILVVVPPGQARFNTAVINTMVAIEHFKKLDGLGKAPAGGAEAGSSANAAAPDDEPDETGDTLGNGAASSSKNAAAPGDEADETEDTLGNGAGSSSKNAGPDDDDTAATKKNNGKERSVNDDDEVENTPAAKSKHGKERDPGDVTDNAEDTPASAGDVGEENGVAEAAGGVAKLSVEG